MYIYFFFEEYRIILRRWEILREQEEKLNTKYMRTHRHTPFRMGKGERERYPLILILSHILYSIM